MRLPLVLVLLAISARAVYANANVRCTDLICCELNQTALHECHAHSKRCPGFVGIHYLEGKAQFGNDECAHCPPGECRVGTTCVCPSNFLKNTTLQEQCSVAYEKPWPDSVGHSNRNCSVSEVDPDGEKRKSWFRMLAKRRRKDSPGIILGALVAILAGTFYFVVRWRRESRNTNLPLVTE